jgi:pimeloyl-[acyl-carrier protein] methyl ester esterase
MYIEQLGAGQDIVMLHGWSMNSAVWRKLAEQLAASYCVHLVDLPGHGASEWHDDALSIEPLLQELSQLLPKQAHWVGWSLGGMIATAYAERFPSRVNKLVLLASNPKFVQDEAWACAMDKEVFTRFADSLDIELEQTIQRFLLLQARGAENSRETIRQLTQQLADKPLPHHDALRAGLELLLSFDVRTQLTALNCPVHFILGDRDTLVPTTMLDEVVRLNQNISTNLIEGAGHAPFISQQNKCHQQITEFFNG